MPTPTKIIEDIRVDRSKVLMGLLGLLTVIACGVVLQAAKAVFLPLVMAWLLSYILGPVVEFLTRRRVPLGLSVAAAVLIVLATGYLGGVFLFGRVVAFAELFPTYHSKLLTITGELAERFDAPARYLYAIDWGEEVRVLLLKAPGSLLDFVVTLFMVIIFLLFMLLARPYFRYKVDRAFSASNAHKFTDLSTTIGTQISQYLGVQFLISAATGVLVWYALTLLGVHFAVTWGAFAFILNFIPTVGSILASIPPILLALVQFYPSWFEAVMTLIALLTIQVTMGNIITPKVMGDRLNLSPVVVLVSLVFWGWLWGVVGALLSIPIAAAVRIVCGNIGPLKPIAILMGSGRRYRDMSRAEQELGNSEPGPDGAPGTSRP